MPGSPRQAFINDIMNRWSRGQQPRFIAKALTARYQIVVNWHEVRDVIAEVTSAH